MTPRHSAGCRPSDCAACLLACLPACPPVNAVCCLLAPASACDCRLACASACYYLPAACQLPLLPPLPLPLLPLLRALCLLAAGMLHLKPPRAILSHRESPKEATSDEPRGTRVDGVTARGPHGRHTKQGPLEARCGGTPVLAEAGRRCLQTAVAHSRAKPSNTPSDPGSPQVTPKPRRVTRSHSESPQRETTKEPR